MTTAIATKVCSDCLEEKPVSDFYTHKTNKDGLYRRCKKCHCILTSKNQKKNPESASYARRYRKSNIDKVRDRDRKLQNKRYAESAEYREDRKRRAKEWRENNKVRAAENHAEWISKNPNYTATYNQLYYQNKSADIKRSVRQYQQENREKRRPYNAERAMKYVARKRSAIPSWANHCAIKDIYREAKRIEIETGEKQHVDHIVPLKSPIVCGLHVENNLRVIPAPENQSKGNRHWPDCP